VLHFQIFQRTEKCCVDDSWKKTNKTWNFIIPYIPYIPNTFIAQKESQYFENVMLHNWCIEIANINNK